MGNAVGRGDSTAARRAGWIAVGLTAALMLMLAIGFGLFPLPLARIYADDPVLIAITLPVIAVAGLALITDGLQGAIMSALRGTGDVWVATGLYVIAFWGLMVPLGYHLGVREGTGALGFMWAVLAGATLASVLPAARLQIVTGRSARRA